MLQLRKQIRSILNELRNGKPGTIKVYHGTFSKKADQIKSQGLQASSSMGYHSASWYMVSTDFESALFHANAEPGENAVVFEFDVPVDNTKWEGHPYFWPPFDRNSNSKWFALKQPIPAEFIKNVHYVPFDKFLKQKEAKF